MYSFIPSFSHLAYCFKISPCSMQQYFINFVAEYYSIIWMFHILIIHSWADVLLVYFHHLAVTNNTGMNILVQDFARHMFSFLLGIYLGVELLDHVVTTVNLSGICQTFFIVVAPFYIPTSSVLSLLLSYLLMQISVSFTLSCNSNISSLIEPWQYRFVCVWVWKMPSHSHCHLPFYNFIITIALVGLPASDLTYVLCILCYCSRVIFLEWKNFHIS